MSGTFAYNGTTFWNEKRVAFLSRNLDEAAAALAAAEANYERHRRQARALAEEHFDARRIVARVLERPGKSAR